MGESRTPVPSLCINWQHNLKALSCSSLGFRLLLCLGQGLDLGQLFISVTTVLRLISGFSDPNVGYFPRLESKSVLLLTGLPSSL